MSEKHFVVIGISDSPAPFFAPEAECVIRRGTVFSGGRRHHGIVAPFLPEDAVWIDVTVPLEDVFARYAPFREIVVFASGDPLFYGYAGTLQRAFPDARITVFPSFSALQTLAHRRVLPYAEMVSVSLTGRPWKGLDTALLEDRPLIGVLTDGKKGPDGIAARLLAYGYDNYRMHVGECLGNVSEKVRTLSLQEAAAMRFAAPNCVILQRTEACRRFFGIPENLFCHLDGRSNMITKMPVRLLALSMLDLPGKTVLWDIGFCTGSVSVEARLRFPHLDIVAFERREEAAPLLDENSRRFGAPGILGVTADFMTCDLSLYPAPDAVFIGGHGGRLEDMLMRVSDLLLPGGTIVFNAVSSDSCGRFAEAVGRCGRKIAAAHTVSIDSHNPITVLKAV